MKKYLIFVVGFILGIVGTSYAAYKLRAEQASFDKTNTGLNSDNVQGAIDELANLMKYGDATENDILNGKTALVNGKKVIGKANKTDSADSLSLQMAVHTGVYNCSYNTFGYIFNDGRIKHIYYRRVSTNGATSTNMATLSGGISTIKLGTSTSDSWVEYELGDSWEFVKLEGLSNSNISYINIEFMISYVD